MRAIQTSLQSYDFSPAFCSRLAADQRFSKRLAIKKRRQQEVKKQILLLVLSIILVCTISLLMNSTFTKASAPNSETYKYYKSIQLQYGDTLWTVADEYMDSHYDSVSQYIDEVKIMNCITGDVVTAGSYIIVPYYSDQFKE